MTLQAIGRRVAGQLLIINSRQPLNKEWAGGVAQAGVSGRPIASVVISPDTQEAFPGTCTVKNLAALVNILRLKKIPIFLMGSPRLRFAHLANYRHNIQAAPHVCPTNLLSQRRYDRHIWG